MKYCNICEIQTSPYDDQNAGTSGLRKKCKEFLKNNYTENFIQSILSIVPEDTRKSGILVLGGDGRYLCKETTLTSIKIAVANKVKKIMVALNGIISTPAMSHVIKKYGAFGGIIFTASHNPGGPENDFGIKYNSSSGAPALEADTKQIFEISKKITTYKISSDLQLEINQLGKHTVEVSDDSGKWQVEVEVFDAISDYVNLMKDIFDFSKLEEFLKNGIDGKHKFKINIDGRSGVAGPYIEAIFKDMKVDNDCMHFTEPMPDFNGKHPDPNLTYAADFVETSDKGGYDFGAAFDGDADRCMIIGKAGLFVSPSDSIAVIAANAVECVPYFSRMKKLTGVARSMPTSSALDRVIEIDYKNGEVGLYETPTGWKYFGNLMDADKICICGEESFGAGSNHIREKDGIWTSLVWLSILANRKKSVKDILEEHWKKYGRHFYIRYDYEGLTVEQGNAVMKELQASIDAGVVGKKFKSENSEEELVIEKANNFSYSDPVDNSLASNQGLRLFFTNKDRIITRLSGTGSSGATVRIYFEHFETDPKKQLQPSDVIMKSLTDIGVSFLRMKELTGRVAPTVIT